MDPSSPPRDLELSALEAEKEPMAAAEDSGGSPQPPPPHRDPVPPPECRGEKNGLVVKIPPEEEGEEAAALGGPGGTSGSPKFTGLGKEELLREAGTPPWARARLVLLVLFWGGWLGMLGAAAAIVAQAPRCQPLPPKAWWELGALYRAPPKAFGGDLKGVAGHLEHLAGLQVGGLVLGPVYPPKPKDPQNPEKPQFPTLGDVDPELGTPEDFEKLVQTAKKKGLKVIVDLTPNPGGDPVWGNWSKDRKVLQEVENALTLWLKRGAAGIFLDGINELEPSVVAAWRNQTEEPGSDGVSRVLVGGTRLRDPQGLLNSGGPGLLVGPFLKIVELEMPEETMAKELLGFLNPNTVLGWTVGTPWEAWGSPLRTRQLMLLVWGLPGTPVLNYGDEIGLKRPPGSQELPRMPWEQIQTLREGGNSSEGQVLQLCRALGGLRARERSLSLGEAEVVPAGRAMAILRRWDQSERFLLLLNPHGDLLPRVTLGDPQLPPKATVRLNTHDSPAQGSEVPLGELQLQPYQGVLLSFPYKP